jgi:2-phosphoglycolate phosphatase
MFRAVLFDLDGTLADTAPDLALALNRVRAEEGMEAIPALSVRAVASMGARGLLGTGLGIAPEDPRFVELRDRFLAHYQNGICVHTKLFDGMPDVLEELERRQLPWGIVTNKAARFTVPLLAALKLDSRAACAVSGDTTARSKPAPDPLFHAADTVGVKASECLYVGDDERDVLAARAAGMKVLAAGYGYLSGGNPHAWGADGVIAHPLETLAFIDR